MTLRLLILPLLIVCMHTLEAQRANEWTTYRNKERGFSLHVPSQWDCKDRLEPPAILLVQSPLENFNNDYREEMELRYQPKRKGSQLSFDSWIGQMRQGNESFVEVVRGRGKIGPNHADWIVFNMHHWGFEVRRIAYFFTGPEGCYILLCTSVQDAYERHEQLFRKTAESFRLI